MSEKILNKYKIVVEDGYVSGFYVTETDYDYYGQMADFPDICEGWTKFVDGNFVEDLEKKAEIIAEREKKSKKPTWEETIESQVYYTALMTDTLVEE